MTCSQNNFNERASDFVLNDTILDIRNLKDIFDYFCFLQYIVALYLLE